MLTPHEQQMVLNHLNIKWVNKLCPMCHANNWAVLGVDTIVLRPSSMAGQAGHFTPGHQQMPCAAILCQNCGNTMLVNLIVAQVLKP